MYEKLTKLPVTFAAILMIVIVGGYGTPAFAQQTEEGSSNGMPFKSLQEQIDILKIDLAEAVMILQDQIDTLIIEQADQDTLIAAIQSAVATLESRVSVNEADIATLEAMQNLQAQLIDTLDMQVTSLEARVTTNESDIAALVLIDQALQELIMAIEDQMTIVNALIAANATDITGLQSQLGVLQTSLGAVQSQLAGKQDRVNGICAPGSSIREIFADGNVVCEADSLSSGAGVLNTYRSADSVNVSSSIFVTRAVTNNRSCTGANYRAVGGGYRLSGHLGVGNVYRNYPSSNTNWSVTVRADSTGKRSFSTYVVCARVQ